MILTTEFAEISSFVDACVDYIIQHAKYAINDKGYFNIVLSGGITPRLIYSKLAESHQNWQCWNFWFSDERCYPTNHKDLNSSMVKEVLFSRIPLPQNQIFYIQTHLDVDNAVADYKQKLCHVNDFDVVILGLGEDGHTASLFVVDHPTDVDGKKKDVFAVFNSPKPPANRITLSLERLCRSKAVLFLVAGEEKMKVVRQLENRESIPATYVNGKESTKIFYCLKSL